MAKPQIKKVKKDSKGVTYYFTIDTYNENGVTQTSQIEVCQ